MSEGHIREAAVNTLRSVGSEMTQDIHELANEKYCTCYTCGGFYGSNFNQPLCSTCHMFLYPPNDTYPEDVAYAEKPDSGDSGNEEPNVETDFYAKLEDSNSYVPLSVPVSQLSQHKPDKLAERINSLSHPRDYRLEKTPEGLIDSLPTEVLLALFRYLDDVSLYRVTNVCVRWRNIIRAELSENAWQRFINTRWPLFQPQYHVTSWKTIYTKLVESASCVYCLESMLLQNSPPIVESSWRHRRLRMN
jgi:ubiquitin-conjugating enzyme E2 D/E